MHIALAVVAATLSALVFPPFDIPWLGVACLAPLLVALERERSGRRAFLLGWLFGAVYWGALCHWIPAVLAVHGGMGYVGGWAVYPLFCLGKGLPAALFAWLAPHLLRGRCALPLTAALWTGVERLHEYTGFMWLALGNAASGMSVPMRLAPITGVYGVSFVLAMMNVAVALLILRRPRRHLLWLATLPLLYLLPALPPPGRGSEVAVLLQPNIAMDQQWTAEYTEAKVRRLAYLSLNAALVAGRPKAGLVVWPEVPAPFYFEQDPFFRDQLTQMARLASINVLAGVVAYNRARQPLNSAVMIEADGGYAGRYDKIALVPFGEFVPPLFGFVKKISSETGDFAAGAEVKVFPVKAGRVGAFICYESAVPHLVREFSAQGAEVLVNLSNDGYFGRSAARGQHLRLVRMRAAENRRWVLRATNDGITAAVDPAGRIAESTAPYQELAYRANYAKRNDLTLYARWGDWWAWGCLAAALGPLTIARVRRGRAPATAR